MFRVLRRVVLCAFVALAVWSSRAGASSFASDVPGQGNVLFSGFVANDVTVLPAPPSGDAYFVTGWDGYPETSADSAQFFGESSGDIYGSISSSGALRNADVALAVPRVIGDSFLLTDNTVDQTWRVSVYGWIGPDASTGVSSFLSGWMGEALPLLAAACIAVLGLGVGGVLLVRWLRNIVSAT